MHPKKRQVGRHEIELIKTVQAHVRSLISLSVHDADEATTRIASGTLRSLLSEEMLQRAWSASSIRGPVTVKTYFLKRAGKDAIASSACHNAELEERVLTLKDFCRQIRIRVGKETASTIDIIKYVANALGGSHFDPTGKAARKHDLLRRIEAGDAGQLFISKINDRNPLYHEILSIAQAVSRSAQVEEILNWSEP